MPDLPRDAPNPVHAVRAYLLGLQDSIVQRLQALSGQTFMRDAWQRPAGGALQGDGLTCVVEAHGQVQALLERGGCNFSHVRGPVLPPSATANRPELAGAPFEALGVSLVMHPLNPHVPTVHLNVRMLTAMPPGAAAVSWFGGGMDLTPYQPQVEDALHFHRSCAQALAPVGAAMGVDLYARFKPWCDRYFFLKHRQEARGVGGIFFDDFSEGGFDLGFSLMRAVGDAFLGAYEPLVHRRRNTPFGERERAFQSMRRGRYVEFNLVWDRGTHFGLHGDGRTESILMSMPPGATWHYAWTPEPGSPEERLIQDFLQPRDWLSEGAGD